MQQTSTRRRRCRGIDCGPEVEELGRRLAEWRANRKAPARIPTELWQQAAALAGRHGVAPVARALRLDYAALRRRAVPVPAENQPTSFLEWVAPTAAIAEGCIFEVWSGRGRRLRLEVAKVPAPSLAQVLRDFASL